MPGFERTLDVPALHRYLWSHSDRRHKITINQTDLAKQLGVSHDCVYETILHMRKIGLLEVTERLEFGVKRYAVTPPELDVPKVERKQEPSWG